MMHKNVRYMFVSWAVLVLAALLCHVSCKPRIFKDEPVKEVKISIQIGHVLTCRNTLGVSGPDVFGVLQWADLDNDPRRITIDDSWMPQWKSRLTPCPPNRSYALTGRNRIIHAAHSEDDTSIVVRYMGDDREFHRWPLGRRWHCHQLRNSRNGQFVAVLSVEDYGFVCRDDDRDDKGRWRLGVINTQSEEIRWLSTIHMKYISTPTISSVALSEDGKYLVGVGRTRGGGIIHLVDVGEKKVLWEKVPHGEEVPIGDWTVNFNDVCFSPDSKYVYVGANVGLLCFDIRTGKTLSQWRMTGHCTCLDVSPDGRLVAGAMEGGELVYIFDAKRGKVRSKISTGQHSIMGLTFSPDSTLLATAGVKYTNVKIWKMPLVN